MREKLSGLDGRDLVPIRSCKKHDQERERLIKGLIQVDLPSQSQIYVAVTTSAWSSGTSTLCGFQPSCKDKRKPSIWTADLH